MGFQGFWGSLGLVHLWTLVIERSCRAHVAEILGFLGDVQGPAQVWEFPTMGVPFFGVPLRGFYSIRGIQEVPLFWEKPT